MKDTRHNQMQSWRSRHFKYCSASIVFVNFPRQRLTFQRDICLCGNLLSTLTFKKRIFFFPAVYFSFFFFFKYGAAEIRQMFYFSLVLWQQLLAVTRKRGDRDAFTFGLNPATGWARIPPVTPDAANKLFVLKLTSMGLFGLRKLKKANKVFL